MSETITFDQVFNLWLENEIDQIDQAETRGTLEIAKAKGFSSIAEWRLQTALRLGMDKKIWTLETIDHPNEALPNIIIGPYQGWSRFFDNRLETTFVQALEIPEFFDWCKTHDRIIPISINFPLPTSVILFRKPGGSLIHIEGGHRICAVAYRRKIGQPIDFAGKPAVKAAIAPVDEPEIGKMLEFLKRGTGKQ